MDKIDETFIEYASDILGDTSTGLSGSTIIKYSKEFAIRFNVKIPVNSSDFGKFGNIIPNKRTALKKNLLAFNGRQQFTIIKELCKLEGFSKNEKIQELKNLLFSRYLQFSENDSYIDKYEPTAWERVDKSIEEMKSRLLLADTEEKCQAIGVIGRETLLTIAKQVFDKDKHFSSDGTDIGTADTKRMLEAYLTFELSNASQKEVKFIRAAVDFSNQLTHDRTATKKDAELFLIAVISTAALIKVVSKYSA